MSANTGAMTALLPFAGLQQVHRTGGAELAIEIGTLDEPGWSVVIDLDGTPLATRALREVTIERGPEDWLHAWVDDREFHVDCGPKNLTEAIDTFTSWADTSQRLAA